MLKRKIMRKIIITTFSFLTILVICIIPDSLNSKDNYLDVEKDIEYVSNLSTNPVYLLGPNNYLIKTNVLLDGDNLESKIKGIIDYLTVQRSNKIPTGLTGIIPSGTILKDIEINDNIATLNFSSNIYNINRELEERMVEAIVYSIIDLDGIKGVRIKVEDNLLQSLPKTKKVLPDILTRDYGINKVFDISSFNNVEKITLYYVNNIDNKNYYVPVTKYLNDDREKINIIIDNLASNYIYESSLMSVLNENTKLLDYKLDELSMMLNFNNSIFTNNKLLEEVSYIVSESVFASYDINEVIIQVDGIEVFKANK